MKKTTIYRQPDADGMHYWILRDRRRVYLSARYARRWFMAGGAAFETLRRGWHS
jgi:hypothetical protein